MQAAIETLNRLGDQAAEVAWPMFWQSSLLISLMFLADWALRRRVRAAVRYALWWVVLLKLVLPPSLALPTSPSWWLSSGSPALPPTATAVVHFGPGEVAPAVQASPDLVSPPAETLSAAGAALACAGSVSFALLMWILVRWRNATRLARGAAHPPAWLEAIGEENRRTLGLKRPVRLRLVDRPISPAVLGLFRPAILVPEALVASLSHAQLRTVLLHELIHLRRADTWANCFQALLQAAYWWHPLLWLANARVRRLREEAVDDAVICGRGVEVEAYASALLQVARTALQRPLATLALVGILESRSFLRQRIERLLGMPCPRIAGLSLASVLSLLAVGAFALPMGQPEPKPVSGPAIVEEGVAFSTRQPDEAPQLFTRIIKIDPQNFLAEVRRVLISGLPGASQDVQQIVREFFSRSGLDFSPPKHLSFDERQGNLVVRGTLADLDAIENAISDLGTGQERINIKAAFLELSEESLEAFWRSQDSTNAAATDTLSVLTPSQERRAWEFINSNPGVQLLSKASVTTLSGRQAMIQVVDFVTVVTNVNPRALSEPGVSAQGEGTNALYLSDSRPCGPMLDLLPNILADGLTLKLGATATINEFLGYGQPTNSVVVFVEGKRQWVQLPVPRFRSRSESATTVLRDGQTLLLKGLSAEHVIKYGDKVPVLADLPMVGTFFRSESTKREKKYVLVMITPTLVDATGNRLHSDEQVEKASTSQR